MSGIWDCGDWKGKTQIPVTSATLSRKKEYQGLVLSDKRLLLCCQMKRYDHLTKNYEISCDYLLFF